MEKKHDNNKTLERSQETFNLLNNIEKSQRKRKIKLKIKSFFNKILSYVKKTN